MKIKTFFQSLFIVFSLVPIYGQSQIPVAQTPPMGWNSYDCFGAAVTEAEVRENAKFMAENLKEFGWEYIVVDYCWFYPHPPGSIQQNPPQFRLPQDNAPVPWMPMDEFGRLLPDPAKFPSSAHGNGFKELADYVHSLGLKFGIHVMRGIPRQAVWSDSPIMGTDGITASMIADTSSYCPWLNSMWGLDMGQPGAQEYYNSLFELYAEWGVDYVKIDDMDMNRKITYHQEESEGYRKAIENCGRPMVMSLSPNTHFEHRDHMSEYADMWRISADFWDTWEKLKLQFERCPKWSYISGPGSWPDADMLPIGNLRLRGPKGKPGPTDFTETEQYTMLSLWSIFRSPLMIGANMVDADDLFFDLLTNDEVLDVNQNSENAREVYNVDESVIWLSDIPDSDNKYMALFNLSDIEKEVRASFSSFKLRSSYNIRNLWKKEDLGKFKKSYSTTIPPHGSVLLKLSK